jgi:serine/threonine-protein kinase
MTPYVCPHCAEAVSPVADRCEGCDATRPRGGWPLDPHVGVSLAGRYRLIARLGSGRSGDVYEARDESLGGDAGLVAVKIYSRLASARERRRFVDEVRAARMLANPHFVRVYDADLDGAVPFVVMERLSGMTLRAYLRAHGPLPHERALAIAKQIAEALAEAHARGIVHRDLKPENVMLTGPEHAFVKVLDLGAVRMLTADATSSSIGTPRYMAPEQIRQEDVDGRADLYALGVCMFEMLAGKPPFDGDGAEAVLYAHLHAPAPTLPHAVNAPPYVHALLRRLLAKARDERPSSMTDVVSSIDGAGAELSTPRRGGRVPAPRAWVGLLLAASAATIVALATRWAPTSAPHTTTGRAESTPVDTAPPVDVADLSARVSQETSSQERPRAEEAAAQPRPRRAAGTAGRGERIGPRHPGSEPIAPPAAPATDAPRPTLPPSSSPPAHPPERDAPPGRRAVARSGTLSAEEL